MLRASERRGDERHAVHERGRREDAYAAKVHELDTRRDHAAHGARRVPTRVHVRFGTAIRDRLPPRTALLYPAAHARELSAMSADEHPRHLIVIDGTWFHAKKMLAAHPWLAALPAERGITS